MQLRLRERLKFRLERWLQRGAIFQLLVIAGLIVLVALLGGLIAWLFAGVFDDPWTAIWWAFLRLTDPGYLGDDEGMLLRAVSTVITVLGYVLFMGSLIAILTQWLNATMRGLESGVTPITLENHILLLGWTNRTPGILRELLLSEGRVQRFLRRRGTRRLRIVILASEVNARLRQELRERLGRLYDERRLILRSGSSLRIEHLQRVAYDRASVIIVPGADYAGGGAEVTDTRVVKTLISIAGQQAEDAAGALPTVVAELFDTHKIPIARQAYPGELDVIASDAFVSRLIAQNVRHSGLSHIYSEILSYATGSEVYIRQVPEYEGHPLRSLAAAFPRAILLGVVRPEGHDFVPYLNPLPDFLLEADDRLVLLGRSYEETAPLAIFEPEDGATWRLTPRPHLTELRRRILILGWSHKVLALVREFDSYPNERFEIDVLSVVPAAEREAMLHRHRTSDRITLRHLEGNYTIRGDLEAADPSGCHNIVLLGSDWLSSGEEADARTILGYVLLRAMLPAGGPEVLVELMDPENARLFQTRPGEVIVSPLILSHVLAHVALRRELSAVFQELFGPGGAEIFLRPAADYELTESEVTFRDVRRAAARFGETALGVRLASQRSEEDGGIRLNPRADARWRLRTGDEVIVLATT